MDTSKGINPLIPRSLDNVDPIKDINLYFHAFNNQNITFFTSHNFVSLVTPEGLTNTWSNHYPPVRFLCNGNVVHSSSKQDGPQLRLQNGRQREVLQSAQLCFVSLVTPEGLTNTRNHHYTPVETLFTPPVIRTDHSYDFRTGGSGRYYSPLSFVLFPVAMVTSILETIRQLAH